MWNLVGVIVAFVVIIFLIRKRVNFGISILIGSVIIGVFSLGSIQVVDIPKAFIEASFYSFEEQQFFSETIELALLLLLIYVLAKCMQETGAITRLIDSLRTFFSRGGTLGVIPAVYGLMPVPGGALFSAPMIDEEGKKYKLDKNQKNFLNIWFRHIWFPIYPVSSAMILVTSERFSNFNIYLLVAADIPAFIAAILIGTWFLKRFIKTTTPKEQHVEREYRGLKYLVPPVLPIVFYAVLQYFGVIHIRSFLLGVGCSIVLLFFLIDMNPKEYLMLVKNSLVWKLPLAIFGILIFRQMFEVSGANLLLGDIIKTLPIPALFIVILIPLILGTLTGYNLGAIALSYFLVEPFFTFTGISLVGVTSLIFMSSLAGYLISPIHLCNVLSSEYLKTDTTRMYRVFVPAVMMLLVIQTVFVLLVFST
jgi:integral membrane protein (TIGR00529 family)